MFCSPVLFVWEIYDVLAIGKDFAMVEAWGADSWLVGKHGTVALSNVHVLCNRECWLLGIGRDDERYVRGKSLEQ